MTTDDLTGCGYQGYEFGGCGYQGYEFGGGYLDSACFGGRLFDADRCDGEGNMLLDFDAEHIPCPGCRPAQAVAYYFAANMRSHGDCGLARRQAFSLVNDIRKNRGLVEIVNPVAEAGAL